MTVKPVLSYKYLHWFCRNNKSEMHRIHTNMFIKEICLANLLPTSSLFPEQHHNYGILVKISYINDFTWPLITAITQTRLYRLNWSVILHKWVNMDCTKAVSSCNRWSVDRNNALIIVSTLKGNEQIMHRMRKYSKSISVCLIYMCDLITLLIRYKIWSKNKRHVHCILPFVEEITNKYNVFSYLLCFRNHI